MLIQFDEFTLDTAIAELRRGSNVVPLEPQVFDLIRYLAENAGRVVSRDDIIQGVWGGRIVSDGSISTRINAARKALGDDGKSQRLIQTVQRRGFRFMPVRAAPVLEILTRTFRCRIGLQSSYCRSRTSAMTPSKVIWRMVLELTYKMHW